MALFPDTTLPQLNQLLQQAKLAYPVLRDSHPERRQQLLYAISEQIENLGDALLQTAMAETSLPVERLRQERSRTLFQLRHYGDEAVAGHWLDVRINTAKPDKNPPAQDLRKMNLAIGPVAVFGASNFPLAYSTAGGDTASALAAGCPVIVKAHPAHVKTSTLIAGAIQKALQKCAFPEGCFSHIYGESYQVGEALVKHPQIAAVGFTGSFTGGKQLFDWAAQRPVPIPVFAEMGSSNPVYILPEKLGEDAENIASLLCQSISRQAGQFCTKPGLILGIESKSWQEWTALLANQLSRIPEEPMLHPGIFAQFRRNRDKTIAQPGVQKLMADISPQRADHILPVLAQVRGIDFLQNPALHQEVFGPFALIITCRDMREMLKIAEQMEGQLTGTLFATDAELNSHPALIQHVRQHCGRMILNGVPTGVEVAYAMQHGGPFPASTDARFTSVGADAIRRFARPVCYQNWPQQHLPEPLQDKNPMGIWRMWNDAWMK